MTDEPATSASISTLVHAVRQPTVYGPRTGRIGGVHQDSRQVTPGTAFVAVPGDQTDGHAHLAAAVDRGAAMLVVQADRKPAWEHLCDSGVTVVVVPDTRDALGRLASAFYGHPSRQLMVIGVTGTNGKPPLRS